MFRVQKKRDLGAMGCGLRLSRRCSCCCTEAGSRLDCSASLNCIAIVFLALGFIPMIFMQKNFGHTPVFLALCSTEVVLMLLLAASGASSLMLKERQATTTTSTSPTDTTA